MLKSGDDIQTLAADIVARQKDKNPFGLFLGRGIGQAAGIPTAVDMGTEIFKTSDRVRNEYLGESDGSPDAVEKAFYRYLDDLPAVARLSLLQRFYGRIAIPTFYQDLARLIRDGYFARILTINIDTLLEGALDGLKLRRGVDYDVVSLSDTLSSRTAPKMAPPPQAAIHIIKLHGDLAGNQAAITPEQIQATLQPQSAMKVEFMGDILVVAYDFDSPPINNWLTRTRGELVWVSVEHSGEQIASIEQARSVRHVEGISAHPKSFFGLLAMLIGDLTQPVKPQPPAYDQGEEALDAAYLRDQIKRSLSVLASLESGIAPNMANDQIQAQIAYQRKTVRALEEQLRALSSSRSRINTLVADILATLQAAKANDRTLSHLQQQAGVLAAELGQGEPNEDVVSAAIAAVAVLGARAGATTVQTGQIAELVSFAPSLRSDLATVRQEVQYAA